MFSRLINSQFLLKIQHKKRILMITCLFIVGFLLIAISTTEVLKQYGFYTALFASIIIGCTGTFGEAVILGNNL